MLSNIKPPLGQPWNQGTSVLADPSSDSILVGKSHCLRLSGDPLVHTYLRSHSSVFPRGLNAFMHPLSPRMIELPPQRKRSKEAPMDVINKEAGGAVDQRCRPGTLKNNSNSKKMWSGDETWGPWGPRREIVRNPEAWELPSDLHVTFTPAIVGNKYTRITWILRFPVVFVTLENKQHLSSWQTLLTSPTEGS